MKLYNSVCSLPNNVCIFSASESSSTTLSSYLTDYDDEKTLRESKKNSSMSFMSDNGVGMHPVTKLYIYNYMYCSCYNINM